MIEFVDPSPSSRGSYRSPWQRSDASAERVPVERRRRRRQRGAALGRAPVREVGPRVLAVRDAGDASASAKRCACSNSGRRSARGKGAAGRWRGGGRRRPPGGTRYANASLCVNSPMAPLYVRIFTRESKIPRTGFPEPLAMRAKVPEAIAHGEIATPAKLFSSRG